MYFFTRAKPIVLEYTVPMVRHTLKRQLVMITTLVMALVALSVGLFVAITYKRYALEGRANSAQYNLQLVSALTGSDLRDITEARRRVRQNSVITTWLEKPGDALKMLASYDELSRILSENRSQESLYRMVVVDRNHTNLIQVGSQTVESRPLTVENFTSLFPVDGRYQAFCDIVDDPLLHADAGQVLPVIQPLYGYGPQSGQPLGYLLLEISASFLTDRLKGYHSDAESPLYLTLGDVSYRFEDGRFAKVKVGGWNLPSVAGDVTRTRGGSHMVVSTKIDGADVFLSQGVPYSSREETLPLLLLILMVAGMLLAFGALLTLLLNREVREPVSAIQRKMHAIAGGDFSWDPSIEYESELGDIGRGINELSAQVDGLIKGRLADAKERQQLEYRILQAQINPHFLNNTLNSIRWMATIQKADGIAEMTTALANLLRHVSKSPQEWCTITEELSLLDDYFVIQNYRYGGTIELKKQVPERFLDIRIPRFTFQPIVENAVFHGLEPKGGGTITISAEQTESGDVLFSIADDGVGMEKAQIQALLEKRDVGADGMFKSIGMYNVNQRIVSMYGSPYGMTVESTPGVGTRVMILLPLSSKEGT
jgi:two-component system sensor histidine kinase YesM